MEDKGIVLIGLGTGDVNLLTRQAWNLLNSINEIYLSSTQYLDLTEYSENLSVQTFESNNGETIEVANEKIIEAVIDLGQRPEGVVYGVLGCPIMFDFVSQEIDIRANQAAIPVQKINGANYIETIVEKLALDKLSQLSIVDANSMLNKHHPSFPPSSPTIIFNLNSPQIAENTRNILSSLYPDNHGVQLIHRAGTQNEVIENLKLEYIAHSKHLGLLSSLYILPLGENTAFEDFQELIAHLRAPEGCPWDREQTHQTLRTNLLEETYEVLAAIDQNDLKAMEEEFGDLLLQIVLHAQIAAEYGEFNMSDVIHGIHTKLVRRHPHVFGDLELEKADAVIKNWERLKAQERHENGDEEKGLLDSIAIAMPALAVADAYQKRAARVGFDWKDIQGVIDKVKEEMDEFEQAENVKEKAEEFGDLLFSLVNLARWIKVDPETALRETNLKFKTRFAVIEAEARNQGVDLSDMSFEEMDVIWEMAKKSLN